MAALRLAMAPGAGYDRVEKVQENEGGVLIVVEFSVASRIPLAAMVVQFLEDRHQQLEELEALEVFLSNVGSLWACHTRSMRYGAR